MRRQASRKGERLARKRLARRPGTTIRSVMRRRLPGYQDGMVTMKDIINTEARFNNWLRKARWLTPTDAQLLRTHVNLIGKVCQILPINRIVVETNRFALIALETPEIRRWGIPEGAATWI